jgi:hypothetical protein
MTVDVPVQPETKRKSAGHVDRRSCFKQIDGRDARPTAGRLSYAFLTGLSIARAIRMPRTARPAVG